jgi:hypothetical protein
MQMPLLRKRFSHIAANEMIYLDFFDMENS